MKNTLEGNNNRITEVKEQISDLEDRMVEITAEEQNKEKRMKKIEQNFRDLWDNTKCTNIQIIGIPEEEEKKKGSEKIFEEVILENFPNMGKEIATQVQEVQRVPYRINPRRNTPRHILNKLTKIRFKEKILKAEREKQRITYKGILIRLSGDFSAETLQARREWQEIFKVMKEKNLQPRLLYPAKDLIEIRQRNQKLYRQAKATRIQHHQTSFTTNAKGTSLDGKHKRKRPTKTNPNQLRKW